METSVSEIKMNYVLVFRSHVDFFLISCKCLVFFVHRVASLFPHMNNVITLNCYGFFYFS